MNCYLTDRISTPIGDMVLVARDGVLLLLEFDDAKYRVAREIEGRSGDVELQAFKAKVAEALKRLG